jgi:Effector-associated domain 10
MIDQLIAALSKEVEMSAEEIADTLWLALQMQEFQAESVSSGLPLNKEDERGINKQESQSEQGILPNTSDLEKTQTQPPKEQKAGIYPLNQQHTSKSLDLSFKVPDAPSLREPLTLARALKPLMRRIASGRELVLDEAATIQRIADERLWIPVLRPTVEPWLDLELVVDEAISMQIWRHTIRELERLLKNYGIFRDVRVWGLITDENEQAQIRRGIGATAKNQTPRSPKELIDPSGRRLVLVVSDCVSSLWRNGAVTPVLELWAKQGSMAIVQMLPKWLWKRTALGRASEVQLRGLTPGVFNQKLIAKEVSLWDELEEESGVKVPVFTLEPDKVATWAQMLSGKGSIWTSGYVFKSNATSVKQETGLFNLSQGDLSAEQRVQAFRVTASPMARKLAGLLASAPVISLPIVQLIRESLLKNSQQVHVAEVFLGGLLKPLSEINADTNPDYVQYEFMNGVRELLVDSVPSLYVLNVVDEVSKYVAKKVGLSLENFAAVLRNPQQFKDSGIVEEVGYFATVTVQVLRRLGGEYVKVANSLATNISICKVKSEFKENSHLLWQHGNTKIYSLCIDQPWTLSFDALVIPMGLNFGFGSLAQSFREWLGGNFIFMYQSIDQAKIEINKSIISPNEPLLVALPSEINNQLFPLDENQCERFIICATAESPNPRIVNTGKVVESVISIATDRKLKRILIPLLGTGINSLPIDAVAHTMLSALAKSLNNLSSSQISEIIFVDKEEDVIKTINQVAKKLFSTDSMTHSEHLQQILYRVEKGQQTDEDITFLRQLLLAGDRQVVQQLGKYNINIGEGKEIHIGDRIYQTWDEQAIQALTKALQQTTSKNVPSEFQCLIADKTEGFVGREYVFDAIEAFIANNPKGYFTIIGDPGQGKSAILAKYVQDTGCIAYFNLLPEGRNRADLFLESVCRQLIERYDLSYDPLPTNATRDGEFLGQLLDEVAEKRNGEAVIIAVDALDEVDAASYRDAANILYLPSYLPDGLYFILTRRRGVEVPLTSFAPMQTMSLLDFKTDIEQDVRAYIENRLNSSDNLRQRIDERRETIKEFTDKIAEKSENNFMYLRYILSDIESGLYQDLTLEQFPQGLQSYYENHWQRMGMTGGTSTVAAIKILYLLCEVREPISRRKICTISGEDEYTVQQVLNKWKQFLHEEIKNDDKRYIIYHHSFQDFLNRQDILLSKLNQ